MAEKTRYSDAELEEFRAIIMEKLELAQRDYDMEHYPLCRKRTAHMRGGGHQQLFRRVSLHGLFPPFADKLFCEPLGLYQRALGGTDICAAPALYAKFGMVRPALIYFVGEYQRVRFHRKK